MREKVISLLEIALSPTKELLKEKELADTLLDAGYLTMTLDGYKTTEEGKRLLRILRRWEPDFNAYLKNLEEQGYSPNTIRTYGTLYSTFLSREEQKKPLYLWSREDVKEFFNRVMSIKADRDMVRKGRIVRKGEMLYSRETIARLKRMLLGYYAWLRDNLRVIRESPATGINLKLPTKRVIDENEFFREEELKLIFKIARKYAPVWVYYAMVIIFVHALRVGELLPPSKSDDTLAPEISFLEDNYVRYRVKGAGGQKRYKMIKATDEEIVMIKHVMKSGYTADTFRKWFKKIVNFAKEQMPSLNRIKNPHPHMLRHTFYTLSSAKGMSRQELGYLMGWSKKSKMYEVYSHPDKELTSEARLRLLEEVKMLPKAQRLNKPKRKKSR